MSRLPGALSPAAAAAHRALAAALARHGADALPCHRHEGPTSEDADERALVVTAMCPRCPILAPCAAAGRHERFGVWGGVDRSPLKPPKPTTTTETTENDS